LQTLWREQTSRQFSFDNITPLENLTSWLTNRLRGGLSFSNQQPKGDNMKQLMIVTIPHQKFNAAVKDGTIGAKVNRILEANKPEAVYFTEQCGLRQAILLVNLPDASAVPVLAEPWFLTFEANVHFQIVMSPEELKKSGIDDLGKKWG
jgi:hypothetical protein